MNDIEARGGDAAVSTAEGGAHVTAVMIDRWCEAYECGEFPEGERTVGDPVNGRPPLSASEETAVLNVKVPVGMKAALAAAAKRNGMTLSAYARSLLADAVLSAR